MIDLGTPARGLAFIKHIETDDRYPGSRILLTEKSRAAIARQQFDVVAVGDWEWCDDPEECARHHWGPVFAHPHDIRKDDWVLCRNRSWDLTPDPNVYVVRVDDILGKFVVS